MLIKAGKTRVRTIRVWVVTLEEDLENTEVLGVALGLPAARGLARACVGELFIDGWRKVDADTVQTRTTREGISVVLRRHVLVERCECVRRTGGK